VARGRGDEEGKKGVGRGGYVSERGWRVGGNRKNGVNGGRIGRGMRRTSGGM